jgi:hypothetical protein
MDINVPMIQYDFRFPPTTLQIAPPHPDLPRHTSHPSSLLNPATDPPTRLLYLVADELPWPIRIERTMNVTCKDVLDVVYETLQMLVTQPEWFIAEDAKRVVVAVCCPFSMLPFCVLMQVPYSSRLPYKKLGCQTNHLPVLSTTQSAGSTGWVIGLYF